MAQQYVDKICLMDLPMDENQFFLKLRALIEKYRYTEAILLLNEKL
jgi:hypothetical protein